METNFPVIRDTHKAEIIHNVFPTSQDIFYPLRKSPEITLYHDTDDGLLHKQAIRSANIPC